MGFRIKNCSDRKEEAKIAGSVSIITIVVNIMLSILKFIAGILAKSGAMVSDAVHSASDVLSTIIVIIGVTVSGKKSDSEHQYGHERIECVASIVLSVILAMTALGIGTAGMEKIIKGNYGSLKIPGALALAAAVLSIVVKEWMYCFTRSAAKLLHSGALMADAWHHQSDALSSVGAFIGIFGARLGFPILDPIASLIICIFIGKASFDIFRDSINKMIDKACSEDIVEEMKKVILEQHGVEGIDLLKTRLFGSKIYVDVEISMDGSKTLKESHQTAEAVHDAIEAQFPDVKHCMVHVNPL